MINRLRLALMAIGPVASIFIIKNTLDRKSKREGNSPKFPEVSSDAINSVESSSLSDNYEVDKGISQMNIKKRHEEAALVMKDTVQHIINNLEGEDTVSEADELSNELDELLEDIR